MISSPEKLESLTYNTTPLHKCVFCAFSFTKTTSTLSTSFFDIDGKWMNLERFDFKHQPGLFYAYNIYPLSIFGSMHVKRLRERESKEYVSRENRNLWEWMEHKECSPFCRDCKRSFLLEDINVNRIWLDSSVERSREVGRLKKSWAKKRLAIFGEKGLVVVLYRKLRLRCFSIF